LGRTAADTPQPQRETARARKTLFPVQPPANAKEPKMSTHVRAQVVPLPAAMRAVAMERFGGPEVLTVKTLPVPEVDAGDVLIAVDTAGVGGGDAGVRSGPPDGKELLPRVPGDDGSGYIAAVGSRIRRFEVGDKVYALSRNNPKGGFHAQYTAVPASKVAHAPLSLDLEHAGAVPVSGLTALAGINLALALQKGESLIITGASGAAGTLALQLAKLRGARVLAIACGSGGVALARRLGADEAADGHHEELAAACRRFAPHGADAVLALAGGQILTACQQALRHGGRLAHPRGIGPGPGRHPGIAVIPFDALCGAHELDILARELASGRLEVPIAAEYSIEQAGEAHERLAEGHVLGRLVLRMTH
jgi:NADPH:quinone reductase